MDQGSDFFTVRYGRGNNPELISAQPGHGIRFGQGAADPRSDFLDGRVPGTVAVVIVNPLQAVHIQGNDSEILVSAHSLGQLLAQAVVE
ncbi:hypothetical protein D3C75_1106450 [compost metagenome]